MGDRAPLKVQNNELVYLTVIVIYTCEKFCGTGPWYGLDNLYGNSSVHLDKNNGQGGASQSMVFHLHIEGACTKNFFAIASVQLGFK